MAEVYDRRAAASDGGIDVDIAYSQIGTLHRGYFGDDSLVSGLSRSADACVESTLDLVVTYQERERIGHVVGSLPKSQLRCYITESPDGLVLDALRPLGQALARYRNAVAEAKDIRVYAFRTGISVRDDKGSGIFWLEGQDPIEGTTFAPCVTVDARKYCAPGKRSDGFTTLKLPKDAHTRLLGLYKAPPKAAATPSEPSSPEAAAP